MASIEGGSIDTRVVPESLLRALAANLTVTHAVDLFETIGMVAKGHSPLTRKTYKRDLEALARYLSERGITQIATVRLAQLRGYQRSWDSHHLSPATRNRKTDAIKTFFRFLHEEDYLPFDPAEQLIPPDAPEHEPRILTEEEYTRLLQTCAHHPRDYAIIQLVLQTGLRISELVAIRLGDIELPKEISSQVEATATLRVKRSKGQAVAIPLNDKAVHALTGYLKARPRVQSDTLFLNRFDEPLSRRRLQYLVQEYLEHIGISDASVHTLRHTMAAHHVAQGTDIQVIQETLGISLEATEKYIGLSKRTARKALQEHAL